MNPLDSKNKLESTYRNRGAFLFNLYYFCYAIIINLKPI
ncbi:hypothetical protein FORMB_14150 [Formosa sp. Hel1_33_131]|nr:hypothetical protein FORMB_14150 [Formosa sp. Hel1_33_131]